jgi:hypothetical protein
LLSAPIFGGDGYERNFMMNNATNGSMNGWMGGGMWLWTVIGLAVVVLLVVVIGAVKLIV